MSIKTTIIEKFKKPGFILTFLIILIVALFILFSNYGVYKRIKLEIQKKELYSKISNDKKIQDSLKQQIELLKNDKLEIERVAREKYGMVKPGEKVYFIKKEK
jgi:cell division protein FtsB